jgi:hypothetical protein
MHADEVSEVLHLDGWTGPFAAADRHTARAALEAGRVVVLPGLAFATEPAEAAFLNAGAADGSRKNISFDPASGRCHGSGLDPERLLALAAMLDRFARAADGLVRGLVPAYAASLQRARASFRPAEISGRRYSPRHDDRRLHVDAFPSRPLQGRRILRVFTNIAADGAPRAWQIGEPFADHATRFLPRLCRPLPGAALLLDVLGITKGRRSAYDHVMLGLHDAAKRDAAYQHSAPRADIAFPPGTTWLCFTDAVVHAVRAGHSALEQTLHLPVAAMAERGGTPLGILEGLTGRALV